MKRIYIPNTVQQDKPALGSVCLIKVDAADQTLRLKGAVFMLCKLHEETGEYKELLSGLMTNENGRLVIDKLEPGNYKIVELRPPHGYVSENTEVFFSVTLDHSGIAIKPDPIVITNRKAPPPCEKTCSHCCNCCNGCKKYYEYEYCYEYSCRNCEWRSCPKED